MPSRRLNVMRLTSLDAYGIVRVDGASFQPPTPKIDGERVVLVVQSQFGAQRLEDDDALVWIPQRNQPTK